MKEGEKKTLKEHLKHDCIPIEELQDKEQGRQEVVEVEGTTGVA
jgi:hypothetical protein